MHAYICVTCAYQPKHSSSTATVTHPVCSSQAAQISPECLMATRQLHAATKPLSDVGSTGLTTNGREFFAYDGTDVLYK